MPLNLLTDILFPPELPIENHGSLWPEVEHELEARLPHDYKTFIDSYGTGKINSFILIFNPFSTNQYVNLKDQAHRQLDALRTLIKGGESCPYPLFPEPGGLLPVGITDNGDVIHWLTKGSSDAWSVVVNDSRSPEYEEFDCDLTSFLASILTRDIRSKIFPESFPNTQPRFEPISSSRV